MPQEINAVTLNTDFYNPASNPYYGKLAEIHDESFDKIMNNNV